VRAAASEVCMAAAGVVSAGAEAVAATDAADSSTNGYPTCVENQTRPHSCQGPSQLLYQSFRAPR